MVDRKKLGKAGRAAGKRFEVKVREDLEKKGWIVFRNSNDVEFMEGAIVKISGEKDQIKGTDIITKSNYKDGVFKQAKSKWNPFTKMPMSLQSGFPDFICIKCHEGWNTYAEGRVEVQFVECKLERNIDKIEKTKVEWIKSNLHIPVFLARKGEKRGTVKYEEI